MDELNDLERNAIMIIRSMYRKPDSSCEEELTFKQDNFDHSLNLKSVCGCYDVKIIFDNKTNKFKYIEIDEIVDEKEEEKT